MSGDRTATIERKTNETEITLRLNLDGAGRASVSTCVGFLDHMLTALARHARFDLELRCEGDLGVDDHHTAEDCALALGAAIDRSLGERLGIARFGSAYAPLDESLCRCVIDLSGRPSAHGEVGLTREHLGDLATENVTHFLRSLATTARCALHMDLIRGENDHHKAEAAFKSLAMALRLAVRIDGDPTEAPSTKGTLV